MSELKEAVYEIEIKYLNPVKIWVLTFLTTLLISPLALAFKANAVFLLLAGVGFTGAICAFAYYIVLRAEIKKGAYDYEVKEKNTTFERS